MALEKVSFGNSVIFALALAEVTSWTIDLPELRKYFFERNDMEKKYEEYKYKSGGDISGQVYYNNVEGNSKHNSKPYDAVGDNTAYAREYGYESYMEKKVHGIVYNGSVYLEGLRRSLETYTRFLEDCTRGNNSRNGSSLRSNTTAWRPAIESPNSTAEGDRQNSIERCREATRASEHVRRLSELAMSATRELQDIAYARKYKKGDSHDLTKEENELILKLAWFLDRLALYTGYEPRPQDFAEGDARTTSTSSTTPPAPTPPEAERRAMMECLSQNSSQPADERCRYNAPLPPIVRMMMEINSNISGIPIMPAPSFSNRNEQAVPTTSAPRADPVSEQSMELLIASDYRTPTSNLPPYPNYPPISTAVRNVQKRSISSMPQPVSKDAPKFKRSIEGSAINFLKYYTKHKLWEGSNLNLKKTDKAFNEYEVKNHLGTRTISKRAIDNKLQQLRLPEDPFQDLSKYIKHKPGVNYIKDEAQAKQIRAALEKMHNSKPSPSKNIIRKLSKILRPKRTIEYDKFEKNVDLPKESEDPQRDISYYVKNKPGRNYNNNLVQAVQVRAGLQQIFNTGNIEVVRRYGANYNPLIPAPFFAGLIKTMADF